MPDKLGNKVRLYHIIDALNEIEVYVQGITFKTFIEQSIIQSACIRQLEMIGEACNHLTDDFKNNHSHIDWKTIIATRNFLIHQYFSVDNHIIWDIIQSDLPTFKSQILIISSIPNEEQ